MRFSTLAVITVSVVSASLFTAAPPADAAGVVGNGTPESCTEAALVAALTGSGVVTFDCGAAPHSIVLTAVKELAVDTEVDGGGSITLSSGNLTPIFRVNSGVTVLIDDSGAITATDALTILREAVGLGTDFSCPACG